MKRKELEPLRFEWFFCFFVVCFSPAPPMTNVLGSAASLSKWRGRLANRKPPVWPRIKTHLVVRQKAYMHAQMEMKGSSLSV